MSPEHTDPGGWAAGGHRAAGHVEGSARRHLRRWIRDAGHSTMTTLGRVPRPFTGVATLAVNPDKPYLAATRLPDGRVKLIGQMAVDIFR